MSVGFHFIFKQEDRLGVDIIWRWTYFLGIFLMKWLLLMRAFHHALPSVVEWNVLWNLTPWYLVSGMWESLLYTGLFDHISSIALFNRNFTVLFGQLSVKIAPKWIKYGRLHLSFSLGTFSIIITSLTMVLFTIDCWLSHYWSQHGVYVLLSISGERAGMNSVPMLTISTFCWLTCLSQLREPDNARGGLPLADHPQQGAPGGVLRLQLLIHRRVPGGRNPHDPYIVHTLTLIVFRFTW